MADSSTDVQPGTVYLVGAGPGDPGLLTRAGADAITCADVVVHDRLANLSLLALARHDAEFIYVGKASSAHTLTQDEINEVLAVQARRGKRVCRLKGGDPLVFGRGGEEAAYLRERGIPFVFIPGITSAIAVPAYAGIPVTDRRCASSFAVITGHEDADKTESTLDWAGIAHGADTLVFLMGLSNLPEIARQLIANGRPATTPAASIQSGTTPTKRVVTGTLADIAERVQAAGLRSPVITVVGEVVKLREELAWFDTRPLFGKRILVTRSRAQASALSELLVETGAVPVEFPVIRCETLPLADDLRVRLQAADWLVFTSANGLPALLEQLAGVGSDIRALGMAKIAAIGPATAASIREHHLTVDYLAEKFVAESLADGFPEPAGKRIVIVRPEEARDVLPEILIARGATVDVLPVYRTVPEDGDAPDLTTIDAITFTSSSTVKNFRARVPGPVEGPIIACIGPVTANTARELGLPVHIEATSFTVPDLVAALEHYFAEKVVPMNDFFRGRRLRRTDALRRMVRETHLTTDNLIYPMFALPGAGIKEPISSMPGQYRWSVDMLVEECKRVWDIGIPGVLLFGIPEEKDVTGSEASAAHGVVQQACAALKRALPELCIITDVCLCEYTSHGHCGILSPDGEVCNDITLNRLAETALSHARAGADIIAPSDMMDGRIVAIREVLDETDFTHLPIMSYAAKYASAFYGPFREAAGSAPQFGDRRGYQMDPPNRREALRELAADYNEGADILMVKPALAYLDIISDARAEFDAPIAAYNVSGEYSMLHAAAERGWLDLERTVLEVLTAIKRAGADIILTYHAPEIAARLC